FRGLIRHRFILARPPPVVRNSRARLSCDNHVWDARPAPPRHRPRLRTHVTGCRFTGTPLARPCLRQDRVWVGRVFFGLAERSLHGGSLPVYSSPSPPTP